MMRVKSTDVASKMMIAKMKSAMKYKNIHEQKIKTNSYKFMYRISSNKHYQIILNNTKFNSSILLHE